MCFGHIFAIAKKYAQKNSWHHIGTIFTGSSLVYNSYGMIGMCTCTWLSCQHERKNVVKHSTMQDKQNVLQTSFQQLQYWSKLHWSSSRLGPFSVLSCLLSTLRFIDGVIPKLQNQLFQKISQQDTVSSHGKQKTLACYPQQACTWFWSTCRKQKSTHARIFQSGLEQFRSNMMALAAELAASAVVNEN